MARGKITGRPLSRAGIEAAKKHAKEEQERQEREKKEQEKKRERQNELKAQYKARQEERRKQSKAQGKEGLKAELWAKFEAASSGGKMMDALAELGEMQAAEEVDWLDRMAPRWNMTWRHLFEWIQKRKGYPEQRMG